MRFEFYRSLGLFGKYEIIEEAEYMILDNLKELELLRKKFAFLINRKVYSDWIEPIVKEIELRIEILEDENLQLEEDIVEFSKF